EFRKLGKIVIVGGPFVSLCPEVFRNKCDILVRGELESIASTFFADLEAGKWQEEYIAGQADITSSPIPRWDLYPADRAFIGCIQTSRGCPFECEFCDVIQYLGRKQRHKTVDQIIAELDILYSLGFKAAFIADDNFTVFRSKAKEILIAIREWNRSKEEGAMEFSTQISIDAARDPELIKLCSEAGITCVFVGIESVNQESLKETKKRQNIGVDIRRQIQLFLDNGIIVFGGMICGFDHDGPDIFEKQFDFAMSLPITIFTLGPLVAPSATPLYTKLKNMGRLVEGSEVAASPWETNIIPARISRKELTEGISELFRKLYLQENMSKRIATVISLLKPVNELHFRETERVIDKEYNAIVAGVIRNAESCFMPPILKAMKNNKRATKTIAHILLRYAQVLHIQDVRERA